MNKKTFWVTNISNMNVSLRDLNISLKAMSHANLLDERHYSYTLEQLQKSAESGSIYRKRNKIKIRKVPPPITSNKLVLSRQPLDKAKNPALSRVKMINDKFDELLDDENDLAESIASHIEENS